MLRAALAALSLTVLAAASPAFAQSAEDSSRLMIVNGNTGKVIYDDGRDDLFCVTRRVFVGYNDHGRKIFRRTMRCR
jgi:predicted regulator of Ras-like GTPase activity (Roadblock/LC7/MglB family)